MGLLREVCRGAVAGGKKSLYSAVITRWGFLLVGLDWSVLCTPEWGAKVPWWKKHLHNLIPSELIDESFLVQMESHKYTPAAKSWGGTKPAYGTVGNKGKGKGSAGHQCIDAKMGKVVGSAPIHRMVRTPDGREMLEHKFLEEMEEALKEVKDMGEACHFFFSEGHLIITDGEGARFRFKDIRRTPDSVARKFKGVKTGEYPGELKDESATSA
jgi:hypothetical protein